MYRLSVMSTSSLPLRHRLCARMISSLSTVSSTSNCLGQDTIPSWKPTTTRSISCMIQPLYRQPQQQYRSLTTKPPSKGKSTPTDSTKSSPTDENETESRYQTIHSTFTDDEIA